MPKNWPITHLAMDKQDIACRHGLFAEYIFAGNSNGNFKFGGKNGKFFLLYQMYHTKL